MKKSVTQVKGQAMIETLVVLVGAILPITFGLYYLGKYLEIRDATIEASRYAAWETTVANPNIEATLGDRFFKNELAGFRNNSGNERNGWGADRIHRRQFDDGQTMANPEEHLIEFASTSVNVTDRSVTTSAGRTGVDAIERGTFWLGATRRGLSMNVDQQGLIESEVSIPLGRTLLLDMDGQYDPSNMPAMRVSSSIMSDSWAPTNVADFRAKTDGLVPFDNGRAGLRVTETLFSIPGATGGSTIAPEFADAAAGGFKMVPIDQSTILPDDRMSP